MQPRMHLGPFHQKMSIETVRKVAKNNLHGVECRVLPKVPLCLRFFKRIFTNALMTMRVSLISVCFPASDHI